LIHEEVRHGKFGAGTVTSHEGGYITVLFSGDAGEKRFQYPGAFSSFLTFTDPARQQEVEADIQAFTERQLAEKKKKEEEAAQLEEQKRLAMLPVKRATAKKKPAAKVKAG